MISEGMVGKAGVCGKVVVEMMLGGYIAYMC
jgi:hypothetical protein